MVLTWIQDRVQRLEFINDQTERYRLEKSGHIEIDKTGAYPVYKLTKKGEGLLQQIEKKLAHEYGGKSANKPHVDDSRKEDWLPFIKKFNEMFPKGKRKGSSTYYRCNENELFERFLWFFGEYPEYSWEEVLDATLKYVTPFHISMDYQYMNAAKYFIKKEDKNKVVSSALADALYNIKEGNEEEVDDGTVYFGP